MYNRSHRFTLWLRQARRTSKNGVAERGKSPVHPAAISLIHAVMQLLPIVTILGDKIYYFHYLQPQPYPAKISTVPHPHSRHVCLPRLL